MRTTKTLQLKINPQFFCIANTKKCVLYQKNNYSTIIYTIPHEQEVPFIQISENKFVELETLVEGIKLDKAKSFRTEPTYENEIVVDNDSIKMFPYEPNWITKDEVEVKLLYDAYVYYKAKQYLSISE